MEVREAITQLKELIRDRQSLVVDDDSNEWNKIWLRDIEALRVAIEALEKQAPKELAWNRRTDNA